MSRPHRQAEEEIAADGDGLPLAALNSSSDHAFALDAVRRAQAGDTEAVRTFLQAIAPTVRRTCTNVLGGAHTDLEDSIQESLFASAKALRNYRFDGDIRHYVAKIALRISIAARRSSVARWHRQGSLQTQPAAELPESPGEDWSSGEVDLVRRILERLPSAQREALLLRVVWGFTVEEIATMTAVSQNTVKTRLRLGKNALRRSQGNQSLWRRWLAERMS